MWFWSLAKVSLKFNDQFLVFLFILAVRREKAVTTIEGEQHKYLNRGINETNPAEFV